MHRGNGTLDTEDLNGDNVLNASGPNENVFRYIVDLLPGGQVLSCGTAGSPAGRSDGSPNGSCTESRSARPTQPSELPTSASPNICE